MITLQSYSDIRLYKTSDLPYLFAILSVNLI